MKSSIKIKTITGNDILPYVDEIAKLRIKVFNDFPYLYEGDYVYEKEYLQPYVKAEESAFILVFDENKVVGASTCIPLYDEIELFKKPFLKKNINLNTIMYYGESVLLKEYRGQGIGVTFFDYREAYTQSLVRFNTATFCAVERSPDHPGKPSDYVPLDSFWRKRGFEKRNDLYTWLSWKEAGQKKETKKKMIFWLKKLK